MALAERLADRVEGESRLRLFARPTTGVVLWGPASGSAAELRERLEAAFVSLATVHEQTWLRSVAANPDADPDLVVDAVLGAL